jgi:hypothetical protein
MPKPLDPLDDAKPKRTKAERQAAKAARIAARPMRDHPRKGQPKPKPKDGGTKNPKAKRPKEGEYVEARVAPDGFVRITMLDPTETASEWIIVPEAQDGP